MTVVQIVDDKFTTWLNRELKTRGWSHRQLGEKAKVSGAAISAVISGVRNPGWDLIAAIAVPLGKPPLELFRLAGLLPEESHGEDEPALLHHYRQLSPPNQRAALAMLRGRGLTDISRLLIAAGHYQPPGNKPRRVDWSVSVLYTILVARDYTGIATYNFRTGAISIDIPQIISPEQFERVQARLKSTNAFSPRRTKHHHYLLSGLGVCGFCGRRLYGRTELYFYGRRADGTKVKYYHHKPRIYYRCPGSARSGNSDCPGLRIPDAIDFEWRVWRWVVDNVIVNDAFFEQAGELHRAEQQQVTNDHDAQLDRLRHYLAGLDQRRAATRARYARGGLSEADLDAILAEIDLATLETRAEIAGLVAARDTARAAAAGAESMRAMIAGWRATLAEIDVAPGDMAGLSEADQEDIYRARREIVREVAVAVRVWGADRFEVEVVGW